MKPLMFLLGTLLVAQSPSAPPVETYFGMCDASAVTMLSPELCLVGDDEDSWLRVYRRPGGVPVAKYDLTGLLGFTRADEADLEGSARIGDRIYWITSHGNNRKGLEQPSRHRLFAVTTALGNGSVTIRPVGRAYARLVEDLLTEPRLRAFDLARATKLPPKTPGALNIEGLAATPEGHLWIGFRNPIPRGRALLVPLLNPSELLEGQRARLGDPVLVDLDGYGIRSLERYRDGYLIVAGSVDGRGESRLYTWAGPGTAPRQLDQISFRGVNPEAISIIEREGGPELFVVSDDGTRRIGGTECKKLKAPAQRCFRAMAVPLPSPLQPAN